MIKEALDVREKATGKVYAVMTQMVDLNFDGKYVLRYNIGINGHHEWTNICCIYSNDEFNDKYEVVKWQKSKQAWVLESEYKFWEDE